MVIGGFIIFTGTLMVTVYENQLLSFFNKKNKNSVIKKDVMQNV